MSNVDPLDRIYDPELSLRGDTAEADPAKVQLARQLFEHHPGVHPDTVAAYLQEGGRLAVDTLLLNPDAIEESIDRTPKVADGPSDAA